MQHNFKIPNSNTKKDKLQGLNSLTSNRVIKFIVYSNIWISIGSAFLCWQVFYLNELTVNYSYLYFVFFSTLFSYNFQRVARLQLLEKQLPDSWVVQNKKIAYSILFISFIGALATVPIFEAPFSLFWIFVLAIVSGGYSYKGFRDIPYLKIILISASWGIACGILPLIISGNSLSIELLLNFILVFCYILAITIPFDIRDLGVDEDKKRTLPQVMGIVKAKRLALFVLTISILLFLFIFNPLQSIIYAISCFLSGLLIYYSNKKKPDFYFTLLIDGHIIFQFLLIFFLS